MSHHLHGMKLSTRGAFLVGLGAALAGSALASIARPLAVVAIKQGVFIRHNVRSRVEEVREDLEDVVAQAENEYRAARHGREGEARREGA